MRIRPAKRATFPPRVSRDDRVGAALAERECAFECGARRTEPPKALVKSGGHHKQASLLSGFGGKLIDARRTTNKLACGQRVALRIGGVAGLEEP